MKLVQYIFANKGLGMSGGKLAAQVAHAAVEAALVTSEDTLVKWRETGYTKVILEARDTEHLRNIEVYLAEKGFAYDLHPIIDEGRTEVPSHSFTALGVNVLDKDDPKVAAAFADFKTYRDPKPAQKKRFRLRDVK